MGLSGSPLGGVGLMAPAPMGGMGGEIGGTMGFSPPTTSLAGIQIAGSPPVPDMMAPAPMAASPFSNLSLGSMNLK